MKHVARDENAKVVETSDSVKLGMLSCNNNKGYYVQKEVDFRGKVTQNYATLQLQFLSI